MRTAVVAVSPAMKVEALRELLLDHGIGGAPVIDARRRAIGIVSRTDVLKNRTRDALVADIMTPLTLSISPEAPVAQAAALMVYEGIHRLVVVDDDGTVVGIVTPLDILRAMALDDGYALPGR